MRKMIYFITAVFVILLNINAKYIHHCLKVDINPDSHFINVVDKISFKKNAIKSKMFFLLDKNLTVSSNTPGLIIRLDKSKINAKDFGMDVQDFSKTSNISQNKYLMIINNDIKNKSEITLTYTGKINYEIKSLGSKYDRGFSQTPGLISDRGIYLAGSTYWIPWFNEDFMTYDLTVTVPKTWDIVSHGKRTTHKIIKDKKLIKWESKNPVEEIFIIGAKFHEYGISLNSTKIMVFLRTPDENLANKYLETTVQYMKMYGKLIGDFPYAKFALVENFWETGYGMPSFTLLGQKIIRFPFILHSSYPHELLHNYWGNSVYVDFKSGNWCEGLTVYMADHLIKEQRGQGLSYRRDKLQRFTDYVNAKNDFPLSKFLSRDSSYSEAIGYGKSMMVMEMLRYITGDKLFIKALQKFYRDNKFKSASYDDIRIAFESVTGKNLKPFFKQWIKRRGAPELKISNVKCDNKDKTEYRLSFRLSQIQKEDVFTLDIPVAVSFKDTIKFINVKMNKKEQSYVLSFHNKPLLIQVDPRYNVFRRLNYLEIPPTLSKIYGSSNILVVLPSGANKKDFSAYLKLSERWNKKNIEVILDKDITVLPSDKDIWIFGSKNLFENIIYKGIAVYDAEIKTDTVRFGQRVLDTKDNSFVISLRNPNNPKKTVNWLKVRTPETIDTLANKLMHYGKYSYLAFQGKDVVNSAKGNWNAIQSPLMVKIDKNEKSKAFTKLPKRNALAYLRPLFSAKRMMKHIKFLASDKLRGRGLGTPGIELAANYIVEQFKKIGLKPGGENGDYFQSFTTVINAQGKKGVVKNIIGYIQGTEPKYSKEAVIVSAHYDHLGLGWPDVKSGNRGKIHNGADDNASGISVMLELAQLLNKTYKPKRSIVFIAFTAEENGLIGSKYFVNNYKKFPMKKIIGNINLDTVGRLKGQKILVLNTSSAREWKFIFTGAGYVTGIASEMVSQQITASDQKSFIIKGIPAVQIFSGGHLDYHTPEDDIDKIDSDGLIKIASFVKEGIVYLADTDKKLTFKGLDNAKEHQKTNKKSSKRRNKRVSTGIMPDFAYNGRGVKIVLIKKDSPADKAGLRLGDIIIKLGKYKADNLREYSNDLKHFKPNDKTVITYIRDGKEFTTTIVLSKR